MKQWKLLSGICLLAVLLLTVSAAAAEPAVFTAEEDFPVLTRPAQPAGKWGAQLLAADDGYEVAKQTIRQGIREKKDTIIIDLTGWADNMTTEDAISSAYFNAVYDYPEDTFYARTGLRYSASGNQGYIYPTYQSELLNEGAAYRAAVDQAVEECFAPGMTDLEKVVVAHDWLVIHCEYDPYVSNHGQYTAQDGTVYRQDELSYTSYGVFVNGKAVCQGYALAFKVLMDRVGIPCCYASSDAMGHGWNMVQLDGKWYHIDATLGDAQYSGGDYAGRVVRSFLLKSDVAYENPASGREEDVHTGWTTEYSYTCGESCSAPGVAALADLPVFLWNGQFCGFVTQNSQMTLCSFPLGSDLAPESVEKSMSIPHSWQVAALDEENGNLYGGLRIKFNGNLVYWIYYVDLTANSWRAIQYQTVSADPDMGYGLKIRDEHLYTWCNYAPVQRYDLRPPTLTVTDAKMPVTLGCLPTVRFGNLTGSTIHVTGSGLYTVYLACYNGQGKLLSLTAMAAGEGKFTVPAAAIAADTETVKFLTFPGDGTPRSGVLTFRHTA